MPTAPEITRIDLEQVGQHVSQKIWRAGWREGDSPWKEEWIQDISVFYALSPLEREGFTVEMVDADHGRALRGKITRLDFIFVHVHDGRWQVERYPYGWTAKTKPIKTEIKDLDFDIEIALGWCRAHGWTVHKWPGGARAWLGEVLPVRDRTTILRMRRVVEEEFRRGHPVEQFQYDLSLDY